MTPSRLLRRAVFCGAALLPLGAAHAVAVVTYTGYASADSFGPNRVQQTDSGTTSDPATYAVNAGGNIATSVTDSAHGGSVYAASSSVGATLPDGSLFGGVAGANTTLSYRVTLVGPDLPGTVPVHIVAAGFVDGAGATQASISFVLNYDNGVALLIAGTSLNSPTGNSFTFDQVERFRPNAFFDIYLSATSGSGGVGVPAGASEAFVDPVFTIDDPAYASLYHFEGVPGAVPEPASGALALFGVGLLGMLRRRAGPARAATGAPAAS